MSSTVCGLWDQLGPFWPKGPRTIKLATNAHQPQQSTKGLWWLPEATRFLLIFGIFLIPVQHSPPARQTRSQARAQAFLTTAPRALLDGIPKVLQPRDEFGGSPGEDGEEEEEESDGTEGVPAPVGESQGTGRPTLAHSNQPVSHQSEPSLLAIMQKMIQIMANLQEASSSKASRPPAFKTLSMKGPEFFYGTQHFKLRSFIQCGQLIFHNYPANSSQDRKKVLYTISFLIGRAAKWIEPYLFNLTNQDTN
ncbi:hypothetical protein O181_000864 [Austropuccinia psidii MF-1]|uniref:DUF4939 domain-containing protein n=1 Tax=Austropuccinia psidii MF-1 TaxID=1389203 RepID=A0A9Q3B9C7_9BASI|nr:hypothetical protein [Austropuccinia psidii MF-1]